MMSDDVNDNGNDDLQLPPDLPVAADAPVQPVTPDYSVQPVAADGPVLSGPPSSEPSNVLPLVSLILSVVSVPVSCLGSLVFPCCGMGIGGPLALAGAITGFIGLKKVKAGTASGRGLAMGGMITGIVVIVISILILVIGALFFGLALSAEAASQGGEFDFGSDFGSDFESDFDY